VHPGRIIGWACPHVLVHGRLVIAVDVVGAIKETQQIARRYLGGRGAGGSAETELGPADCDDPSADPDQVTT
jgi:hypothetical protein